MDEYSCAAEPPIRCGVSHVSGQAWATLFVPLQLHTVSFWQTIKLQQKNFSSAEKATNIAKKIDDFGKYINVVAVALDVGIGVYDNIQNKQPIDRILSDATVDAAVSTLQIVATTAITTAIVGSGFGIVALGVGLAVSTVVTGLSDDLKIYKGKSLRDLTKDAIYYSIKHWKPALL